VSSNNNGLNPSWNRFGEVLEDDRLTEHRPSEDISDLSRGKERGRRNQRQEPHNSTDGQINRRKMIEGRNRRPGVPGAFRNGMCIYKRDELDTYSSIRTLPHLLQLELFDSSLIRGDSRALDTDLVLQDGVGSVYGDLIIRLWG
jgi:hypothetical protein